MSSTVHLKLDDARRRLLLDTAVLHAKMPDVLSSFEVDLLWQLSERGLSGEDMAICTPAEWQVVEQASHDLNAARDRRAVSQIHVWRQASDTTPRPSHYMRMDTVQVPQLRAGAP